MATAAVGRKAQRIDSDYAAQESASLPDPEIEAVTNVARAAVLLDQEPTMTSIARWEKGEPVIEMMFDIPWWSVPKSGAAEKTQAQS